jgi:hypothetical protein
MRPRAKEMLSESEAGVLPLSMGRADARAAYTEVREKFTPKRTGLTSMSAGRNESSVALTLCFRIAVSQGINSGTATA